MFCGAIVHSTIMPLVDIPAWQTNIDDGLISLHYGCTVSEKEQDVG